MDPFITNDFLTKSKIMNYSNSNDIILHNDLSKLDQIGTFSEGIGNNLEKLSNITEDSINIQNRNNSNLKDFNNEDNENSESEENYYSEDYDDEEIFENSFNEKENSYDFSQNITFLLFKEKLFNKKTTKSNKLFSLKDDTYFSYVIKFEYENNTDILKTKLDEPIDNLIREICLIFHISNENIFRFFGQSHLESNLLNLKFLRWMTVENLFKNTQQAIQIHIQEILNNNESSLDYKYNQIKENFSKKELISNLCYNSEKNKILKFMENKNFNLTNENTLIINHFTNKFSKTKFLYQPDKNLKIIDKLLKDKKNLNNYLMTKFFNTKENIKINILDITDLESLKGLYYKNIHLNFDKFNYDNNKINTIININARDIKLQFTSMNSMEQFLLAKINFEVRNFKLKFSIKKNETLAIQNIFEIISMIIINSKIRTSNFSLNINSIIKNTDNIIYNKSIFNLDGVKANIMSLKIKDNLFSFSKNFKFCLFLAELAQLFNLDTIKSIQIKNMKINSGLAIHYIFTFINLTNKNLKFLKFVDNIIEIENQNISPVIEINEKDGIFMKMTNESLSLNYLKTLEIINTRILKVSDISKCSYVLQNKNIKFDIDSIINLGCSINKFKKEGKEIKISINHFLEKNYFNGLKVIPPNCSEIIVKDCKLRDKENSLNLFGSILNNFDLQNLKKLKVSRCLINSSNWLNEILNNFSISQFRSLYLDNILIDSDLDLFFNKYENIEELVIKDSLFNFYFDNNFTLKVKTLRLNLSSLFELNLNKENKEKFSKNLKNILIKSNFNTLIIEKESLNFFDDNFTFNNIENLIFNRILNSNPILDHIFIQNKIYVNNLIILNENSSLISDKTFQNINLLNFNNLHINIEAINSEIFNQPMMSSITNFLNMINEKKDNDFNTQKNNIIKNLQFFDFLNTLLEVGKNISIYYKNELELNEFFILLEISHNKSILDILTKAENFNQIPSDLMKELDHWFKTDGTHIIGIKEVINYENLSKKINNFSKVELINMNRKNIIQKFIK